MGHKPCLNATYPIGFPGCMWLVIREFCSDKGEGTANCFCGLLVRDTVSVLLVHIFSLLRISGRMIQEYSELTVKKPSTYYKPSGPEST